jgi:hypothetical protein
MVVTTANRPIVVSVFQDNDKAQQAINDLMNTGFSNDQIKYSVNRGGGGIADDLVNLGLPQSEANFYNNEFEQGHTIVTVNTMDRQQDAHNILIRDGGYDMNSRVSNPQTKAGGTIPPAVPETGMGVGTGPATTANVPSNVANTTSNMGPTGTASNVTDQQARDLKLREE